MFLENHATSKVFQNNNDNRPFRNFFVKLSKIFKLSEISFRGFFCKIDPSLYELNFEIFTFFLMISFVKLNPG